MDLIIGNGLIGRHLYYLLRPNAIMTSRKEIDLCRDDWVLPKCKTAFICAGITSTEYCESHREESQLVNITNTVKLARALKPAKVIWLSSERVFDGSVPFRKVADLVCPATEYGRQKAAVEEVLSGEGVVVVRLSKVIGWDVPLFETWISGLSSGEKIHPFSDMSMSPLPVGFAVRFISKVALSQDDGLYQVSAYGDLPYSSIAYHIANRMGADLSLVEPVAAPKPHPYTTLCDKGIAKKIGVDIPDSWDTIYRWCEDRFGI